MQNARSGVLLDTQVPLDKTSSAYSAVLCALENHGYRYTAKDNYISSIHGLKAGAMGGGMISGAYNAGTTGIATQAIVQQPTNVTAKAGEMAVFTVEATGKDLHYQWQFSNTNGATWGNSSSEGANTATLSVSMQAYRNGQMYRCVITNETGKVISKTAVMTLG